VKAGILIHCLSDQELGESIEGEFYSVVLLFIFLSFYEGRGQKYGNYRGLSPESAYKPL